MHRKSRKDADLVILYRRRGVAARRTARLFYKRMRRTNSLLGGKRSCHVRNDSQIARPGFDSWGNTCLGSAILGPFPNEPSPPQHAPPVRWQFHLGCLKLVAAWTEWLPVQRSCQPGHAHPGSIVLAERRRYPA